MKSVNFAEILKMSFQVQLIGNVCFSFRTEGDKILFNLIILVSLFDFNFFLLEKIVKS